MHINMKEFLYVLLRKFKQKFNGNIYIILKGRTTLAILLFIWDRVWQNRKSHKTIRTSFAENDARKYYLYLKTQ